MSCKRITKTNEEVSELFDTLFNITKDEFIAHELYSYFYTQEFKDIFGDFEIDYKSKNNSLLDRVDENHEPKLFYNEDLNKYYFLDNSNEEVFYPYTRTGLGEHFETVDIQTFAKSLALNYYKDNIKLDFDSLNFINENEVTLRNYVRNFINNKVDELMRSDNPEYVLKGIALENSKENLNEWVSEVKAFYSTLKISYVEDTLEEREIVHNDDLIRQESFLKNSKDNVSNNIKLFLSLLESNKLNSFGDKTFIDFDDIYSTLNKSLKNIVPTYNEDSQLEDIYDIYTDIINDLSNRKPYFKSLYEYLSSDLITDIFKNQFVSAFNLHRNNFLGTEITIDEDGNKSYAVKNLSDINSRKNNILNQWLYNYQELNPKKPVDRIDNGIALINKRFKTINTEEELIPSLNAVKDILNKIGVEFTKEGFDYYLSNFQFEDPGVDFKKRRLLDVLYATKRALKNKDNVENLFKDQRTFVDMAEAESFFQNEGSDASMFSVGKNKWIYSLPSYIDIKVETWKKDRDELLKFYNSTEYNKGSYYMKYLLALDEPADTRVEESKKRINNIEVGIFNSFQNQYESKNATDNKSISYTDSLVDYLNKVLAFKKKSKVYYKTALAGDKSTEYQLHFGNVSVQTNASSQNNELVINDEVLDIFYDYFVADYNRIKSEYQNENKSILHYHTGNAFKSQLFPSLSDNSIIELYDKNGVPKFETLEEKRDEIKNAIKDLLFKNIKEVNKLLVSQNIYSKNLIDNNIANSYNNNFNIAADFYVNSVISLVEYAKMFTGDVAYYKNGIDYKKRVPATYTDGLYMRILPGEEKFNIAVLPSQKIPVPTLDNMKEMLSENVYKFYEDVNTTDAQAWITPERWKFIMTKTGKWDTSMDSIYDKFFQDKPQFTSKELKTLAQPLKGVYFNIDETGKPVYLKYSQAVLLPNLVKGTDLEEVYQDMKDNNISELVAVDGIKVGSVIPNEDFTKNIISLDNRYWKLQQQLATKNVKNTDIGSQIQKNIFTGLIYNLDTVFDVNGKDFTGNNLIDHLNSLFTTLSSLGKQNLFETLDIDPDSYVINNQNKLYDSLIKQLEERKDIPDNFTKGLKAKLSPYGMPGFLQLFQNVFSSLVNKRIIKYQSNGGEFIQMSDYGLNRDEAKKQGIIWTPWMKDSKPVPPKIIGKNKDTGKNIIEPGGIMLSGSFISKYIPNYKDKTSEELFGTLNENTGQYEGGLIDQKILTSIIGYRIPNQALASSDALQIVGILPEESGNTVIPYVGMTTKTGSDFDIDKMFLMIPYFKAQYKQKKKAYDYIKANDLTIDEMKDELREVGYSGVDNMSSKNIKDFFVEDILLTGDEEQSLYASEFREQYQLDTPSLKYIKFDKDSPIHEQSREAIINEVIESYKAILTNPDVINSVMNPIDLDFIEKDIKSLIEIEDNVSDFELFDGIKDVEYRQEYKLGKAGLGQNILSLVDSVRGGMADLSFVNYLGWGNEENGVTVFDKEYSETIEGQPTYKISDILTAMVNGFVDIAKDPYIVKGNWVTQTNGVGFMLLRAGVHPYKVNAFLNQPIIKQYVAYRDNVESISIDEKDEFELELASRMFSRLNEDYTNAQFKNLINYNEFIVLMENKNEKYIKVIKNKISKRTKKNKQLENDLYSIINKFAEAKQLGIKASGLSLNELREQVTNNSDFDIQIGILNSFKNYLPYAKSLSESVAASSIDVNGKGKNIISTIMYNNMLENINKRLYNNDEYALNGFDSKLERNGSSTLLGAVKRNAIDEILKIFNSNPKFFFTGSPTAITTFNQISNFISGETLMNEQLGNIIEKDFYTYILSGFPALSMTKDEKTELLKSLPKELKKLQEETDNLLIQELELKPTDKNNFIIGMNNAKKSLYFRNKITNAWEDLLTSHEAFAEKLIKYAFISTGFNNNINQFHEYIPTIWFNKNRFNSYLKELSLKEEYVEENFIDQFFRNNYDNNKIVNNIFKNELEALKGDSGFKTGFVKKSLDSNNYMYRYNIDTFNGTITRYYKLVGYRPDGHAVYLRTSLLSGKDNKNNVIKEYNINSNDTSMFKNNRIMASQINTELYNDVKNDPLLTDIFSTLEVEERMNNMDNDPSKDEC